MARTIDETLARSFSESFLIYSDLKSDLSDEEILQNLLKHADISTRNGLLCVIDQTEKLLSDARQYKTSKEYRLSCLLYATFFEHKINYLIVAACVKKQVSDDEVKQILRDLKFQAKCTWLLKILGFGVINSLHLKRMIQVFEIRNAFVHYKWSAYNIDAGENEKEDAKVQKTLENVEKTIIYIKKYIDRNIFKNKKKRTKALLKKHLQVVASRRVEESKKNVYRSTNK